jgi:hypothetical protein
MEMRSRTHLQHTRFKNVIFVGILDEKLDDFTLYDYFDEFGLTLQSVDFVLGTAGT